MKTKYIIILCLSIFLLSCEKEIDFNEKLLAPKLVVNGFITADSLIDVKISTSKAIPGVEKDYEWPDDATVKLFVDGLETETLSTYPIEYEDTEDDNFWYGTIKSRPSVGYHTTKTVAEAGKTYRLEISHPDYETLSTETYIPEKAKVIGFDSEVVTENSEGYEYSYRTFKIKFSDPGESKNYYRLSIRQFTGVWSPDYDKMEDTIGVIYLNERDINWISSDDRLLNPDEEDANDFLFGSPSNVYNLFTDDLINGKEYELTFSTDVGYFYYDMGYGPNGKDDPIIYEKHKGEFSWYIISLQSLTREAYLYMRSSYAQHWYGDDFFSEPVQAYSNVENGVGVFAGYNSVTNVLKDGEYPVEDVEYKKSPYFYY